MRSLTLWVLGVLWYWGLGGVPYAAPWVLGFRLFGFGGLLYIEGTGSPGAG